MNRKFKKTLCYNYFHLKKILENRLKIHANYTNNLLNVHRQIRVGKWCGDPVQFQMKGLTTYWI